MAFASLISAVDPVATLSLFGSLGVFLHALDFYYYCFYTCSLQTGVDPLLNILVYGESVINDAVSIVLYRTFTNFLIEPPTASAKVICFFFNVFIFFSSHHSFKSIYSQSLKFKLSLNVFFFSFSNNFFLEGKSYFDIDCLKKKKCRYLL